jgi:hypothetical protein
MEVFYYPTKYLVKIQVFSDVTTRQLTATNIMQKHNAFSVFNHWPWRQK